MYFRLYNYICLGTKAYNSLLMDNFKALAKSYCILLLGYSTSI